MRAITTSALSLIACSAFAADCGFVTTCDAPLENMGAFNANGEIILTRRVDGDVGDGNGHVIIACIIETAAAQAATPAPFDNGTGKCGTRYRWATTQGWLKTSDKCGGRDITVNKCPEDNK